MQMLPYLNYEGKKFELKIILKTKDKKKHWELYTIPI